MKLPPLKTHFLKRQYPPVFTIQSCCKCPRNKYLSNIYLFLNSLHFQNLMPTSFIQWYINQTAPWLPRAFIHSKKCNQSSQFAMFHLLTVYLLKINPVLASVWWHWCSNPARVNGNWFSPCGKDLMACFKGRIIVNILHSVILSLSIYPKEIIQNMGNILCKNLVIILGSYKQSKSPSTWAWLDKWYYTPSVFYGQKLL